MVKKSSKNDRHKFGYEGGKSNKNGMVQESRGGKVRNTVITTSKNEGKASRNSRERMKIRNWGINQLEDYARESEKKQEFAKTWGKKIIQSKIKVSAIKEIKMQEKRLRNDEEWE